jgi:hypothetical protein
MENLLKWYLINIAPILKIDDENSSKFCDSISINVDESSDSSDCS